MPRKLDVPEGYTIAEDARGRWTAARVDGSKQRRNFLKRYQAISWCLRDLADQLRDAARRSQLEGPAIDRAPLWPGGPFGPARGWSTGGGREGKGGQ